MKKMLASGVTSVVLAALPVVGVFAEGIGTYSNDATVGEVDEAIYSVDVSWNDLTWDWKVDPYWQEYELRASLNCGIAAANQNRLEELTGAGLLYLDDECTEQVSGKVSQGVLYYTSVDVGGHVTVTDTSTNGFIGARATFTPTNDYAWVAGDIALNGHYDVASGRIVYDDNSLGDELLMTGGMGDALGHTNIYEGYLRLGLNSEIERTNVISTGDTIGTVTVVIYPKEWGA